MPTKVSGMTELAAGSLSASDYMVVNDTSVGIDQKIQNQYMFETIISAYALTLLTGADAAAVMSALGIDGFAQGWLDDADLTAWLATVGLDADLETFSLPANTTIGAYGKTLLAYADAATTYNAWSLRGGDIWTYQDAVVCGAGASTYEIGTGFESSLADSGRFQVEFRLDDVLKTTNTDSVYIRLEDAEGIETAGYISMVFRVTGTASAEALYTVGLNVDRPATSNGGIFLNGVGILQYSQYSSKGMTYRFHGGKDYSITNNCAGYIDLDSDLHSIHLVNDTDDFTGAGTARVRYRRYQ